MNHGELSPRARPRRGMIGLVSTLLGTTACSPVILPVGQDVTIQVSAAEEPRSPCATGHQDACQDELLSNLDSLKENILASLSHREVTPVQRQRLTEKLAALEAELRPHSLGTVSTPPKIDQNHHPETKLSMLRVGVRPGLPPAEVYLNTGPALGKTPLSIPVPPGTHQVRVEWPDGRSSQRRVLAHRGSTTLVRVE